MPYISQPDRDRLDNAIENLAKLISPNQRAGDLNYSITRLLLLSQGEGRYKDWNELIGVLECAKQEFYRKKIGPYEDKKIKENGDVY
ncbi:MAG TPA: hypothetical protein DCS29_01205 [Candidatus Magasanikbacteria bacterium]|nr:MAG: hypothetical protein A2479_02970 [Candidatus Magasanikbacteria bacterium RIFOXYC2_FULL_39_8]HAT03379.1 hypothetical protein [Candidatus Magasanikbacteria bacterium]